MVAQEMQKHNSVTGLEECRFQITIYPKTVNEKFDIEMVRSLIG